MASEGFVPRLVILVVVAIGITVLVGVPIAVVSWYVGVYLVSRFLAARFDVSVANVVFGEVSDGGKDSGGSGGSGQEEGSTKLAQQAPSFTTVLALLLIPLVLISFDTVLDTLVAAGTFEEGTGWIEFLGLLGQTPVALLITVLAAIFVLGRPNASMATVTKIIDQALGPICSIILITGAGGMFGGVLELSGIGAALSDSLANIGISLILQAFLISTLLRVAQGSATVALTTTAGLMAGPVNAAGLGDFQLTLLVVAIAAGATVLSHVNDSGFWLVSRFFGMDEKTTLKTWTVMETTLGVSAFAIAAILWVVV
ncbi:MAG: Low-affinity gluconate/H+ symporter GntU [uncultured Nocardioidaceae bacterium]|uniref:Low-affinity gluconate/H+ symporter GntU n=1 Tax=uncultured Nocardioidaceae bacterium TaxID=253824 RepID=A0A6J4M495_9ACTN|nr:MAG: Low-affinity gluconate/H+ symporter GntU [uncultured Nocardioidaceae bacterium]